MGQPSSRLPRAARALLSVAAAVSLGAAAQDVAPPPDPAQSIVYWQPHVIEARADPAVAEAQRVFAVLLRGWDSARLEPTLHVVRSGAGPWAASLADGNILLSRAAIETCARFGPQRARHLLAFVLAHELAHQRADDLWHQKFFRLAGAQAPALRQRLIQGLGPDELPFADLERREARADQDGLVLMGSVGFDPFQVLERKDFFTAWVESLWGQPCEPGATACAAARTRALRARVQLERIATQTTLYELGVQAFVAGDYPRARHYFTAYGRDYPSRAVLAGLGTAWLAEALELHRALPGGGSPAPDLYYPLALDARPQAAPAGGATRGGDAAQGRQRLLAMLAEANRYYERALRLEPGHRASYLLLATSHLLEGNPYLVRGVLQGRYLPRFGADASSTLLLALTSAVEGDRGAARRALETSLREGRDSTPDALPAEQVRYATFHNLAALAEFDGDSARAREWWKRLAGEARAAGESHVFRLALARLSPGPAPRGALHEAPTVRGLRLGDRARADALAEATSSPLWLNGSQLRVWRGADGSRLVLADGHRVRHAWQAGGDASTSLAGLAIGDRSDRPLKTLGMPSRRLFLLSGEYLAYDAYGIALHLVAGRVAGWFLYAPG